MRSDCRGRGMYEGHSRRQRPKAERAAPSRVAHRGCRRRRPRRPVKCKAIRQMGCPLPRLDWLQRRALEHRNPVLPVHDDHADLTQVLEHNEPTGVLTEVRPNRFNGLTLATEDSDPCVCA